MLLNKQLEHLLKTHLVSLGWKKKWFGLKIVVNSSDHGNSTKRSCWFDKYGTKVISYCIIPKTGISNGITLKSDFQPKKEIYEHVFLGAHK